MPGCYVFIQPFIFIFASIPCYRHINSLELQFRDTTRSTFTRSTVNLLQNRHFVYDCVGVSSFAEVEFILYLKGHQHRSFLLKNSNASHQNRKLCKNFDSFEKEKKKVFYFLGSWRNFWKSSSRSRFLSSDKRDNKVDMKVLLRKILWKLCKTLISKMTAFIYVFLFSNFISGPIWVGQEARGSSLVRITPFASFGWSGTRHGLCTFSRHGRWSPSFIITQHWRSNAIYAEWVSDSWSDYRHKRQSIADGFCATLLTCFHKPLDFIFSSPTRCKIAYWTCIFLINEHSVISLASPFVYENIIYILFERLERETPAWLWIIGPRSEKQRKSQQSKEEGKKICLQIKP